MIIRNLAPNPSIEVDTSGWTAWTGAGTVTRLAASSLAADANCWVRVQSVASQGTFGFQTTPIPVTPGPLSVGVMLRSNVADSYGRIRFHFRNAAGALLGGYQFGPVVYVPAAGFARATGTVTAPAGTVDVLLVFQVVSSVGATITVPSGSTLDADALMVTPLDWVPDFKDGSDPGWVWEGAADASASRGPEQPYFAEAEVWANGSRVASLDLVDGLTESAESMSRVQVSPFLNSNRSTVHVAPSDAGTGTLTARFVVETGEGMPGERARSLMQALRTGAPMEVRFNHYEPGLSNFAFVPTGVVSRTYERDAQHVWSVTADYTALDV